MEEFHGEAICPGHPCAPSLAAECSVCGGPLSPGACGAAGGPLEDSLLFRAQFVGMPPLVPGAWQERLRELSRTVELNRRFATVMSIDLSGYGRLMQGHSGKRLDQLLQWLFAVISRHVDFHGGYVMRMRTDGVLASFGAPWSFACSAESAARAAFGIRDEVRAGTRPGAEGEQPSLRIGMSFGPVSVRLLETEGKRRPEIQGNAVAESTLMESQAGPWEVRVSPSLTGLMVGRFRVDVIPPSGSGPVGESEFMFRLAGYRVPGVGAVASGGNHSGPLAGRDEPVATLVAALRGATRREFHAFWIQGAAGVGRTRVAGEALAQAPQSVRCLSLRVTPECRHWPLSLVISILGGLGLDVTSAAALAGSIRRRYLSLPPATRSVLETLLESPLEGEELPLQAGGVALAELLAGEAGQTPIALHIAGLSGADEHSRRVLGMVLGQHPPGLVLMATGADAPPVGEPWRLVTLPPLDEAGARELLDSLEVCRDVDSALKERLVEESAGVPVCLVEMSRELAMAPAPPAVTRQTASRFRDVLRLSIPPRLLELLQGELDLLSPARRTMVQLCALIGPRFLDSEDSRMVDLARDLLPQACVLKGLQPPAHPLADSEFTAAFSRSLARGAAYGMLTSHQRRRLHQRVAEKIEKWQGENGTAHALEVAFHYARGDQFDRATAWLQKALELAGDPHDEEACRQMVLEVTHADRSVIV